MPKARVFINKSFSNLALDVILLLLLLNRLIWVHAIYHQLFSEFPFVLGNVKIQSTLFDPRQFAFVLVAGEFRWRMMLLLGCWSKGNPRRWSTVLSSARYIGFFLDCKSCSHHWSRCHAVVAVIKPNTAILERNIGYDCMLP